MIVSFQAIQTYVIDAFTLHAASGAFIIIFCINFLFLITHISKYILLLLYSTCSSVMSAIISWFWVPFVRSSHVQQTWIWERRYGACVYSYSIRMPFVRLISRFLFFLNFFHSSNLFLFFSPFVLWKYGRRIRMSSKYAHKPLQHHHQTQNKVQPEQVEEAQPQPATTTTASENHHSKENNDASSS